MPGLKLDFSKHDGSSQLNGILLQTGLRGMLEGNDCSALELFFSFVFPYVDTWMGYKDGSLLTQIHVRYAEIKKSAHIQ